MNSIGQTKFQSASEIEKFQLLKLNEAMDYLRKHSSFYQSHFDQHGINITKLASLSDLQFFPTISKANLQDNYEKFLCVEKTKIAEYTTTSGTSGTPVTIPLTTNDLKRLGQNEYQSLNCAGCVDSDVFQLMVTMDRQFIAGLAYHQGIQQLGAATIRVGPGVPAMQWETIFRLNPTVIIAVPSFLVILLEYAHTNNIDVNSSSVKKAICIGENIRTNQLEPNTIANRITEKWNIELISTYASTELQTAFTECEHHCGNHLLHDLIYVEILDQLEQPITNGELGEITITNFEVEAMPLWRFKTGDMARAHVDQCKCGRNTMRLGPIEGRKHQMIKLKGTTLFPPAICNVLNAFIEIEHYVIEVSHDAFGNDQLRVRFCSTSDNASLLLNLTSAFKSSLRVAPLLTIEDLTTIQNIQKREPNRKLTNFIDLRRSTPQL